MTRLFSANCGRLYSRVLIIVFSFAPALIVLPYQVAAAQLSVSNITSFVADFNGTKFEIPFPEGWTGIEVNNASMNFASPNGYDFQTMQPKPGTPVDNIAMQINSGPIADVANALPLKGFGVKSFAEYITKVPDDQKQLFLGFRECKVVNDSLIKLSNYDAEKTELLCGNEGKKVVAYSLASDNKNFILVSYGGLPEAVDHHLAKIEQSLEKLSIPKPTNPMELIAMGSR